MMKLIWILILGLGLLTVGCKRDVESDEKKVEQILGDGNDYQELIRNPITADENMDTVNIAVAKFDEVSHDFGDIKAGDIVTHTFHFVNAGKVPLLIKDATSSCGCTVPEIPKQPIAPGEKGEILVRFNSENKSGYQSKVVTVFTNGYPSKYLLTIKTNILK
ncbi:MAG: DUF1573 domain-containing protein [Saprospiraceae bacterium]|nr:DUF1573 domain-containing protein [Saprospiraceae bacterium]